MGLSYEGIVYQGRLLGGGDIWVLWAPNKYLKNKDAAYEPMSKLFFMVDDWLDVCSVCVCVRERETERDRERRRRERKRGRESRWGEAKEFWGQIQCSIFYLIQLNGWGGPHWTKVWARRNRCVDVWRWRVWFWIYRVWVLVGCPSGHTQGQLDTQIWSSLIWSIFQNLLINI